MKRYDGLWEHIATFEALYAAYEMARAKRHFRPEIMGIGSRIEDVIHELLLDLETGEWRPQKCYDFECRKEVKRRIINAPTFRDRILHRAIVAEVQPLFEKKMIFDSYASRPGKGTHAAVRRVQHFLRGAERNGRVYVLQCDIHHYYASVDHEKLKSILRQTIADEILLKVWDAIIDGFNSDVGKGMPIGALTSQLCANVYLNTLDHFVKECIGAKRYLRYMDDFLVIENDKKTLWSDLADIKWFLDTQLRLTLNPKTQIYPASRGIDFAGYRTWSTHIKPRKRNVKAARKRFRALSKSYARYDVNLEDVKPRVMSFLGYTKHCQARQTTESTLRHLVCQRGE